MWFTVGDDLLASRFFDEARQMVESGQPLVDGGGMVGQLSPGQIGEGATLPRPVEVIESRLQARPAR